MSGVDGITTTVGGPPPGPPPSADTIPTKVGQVAYALIKALECTLTNDYSGNIIRIGLQIQTGRREAWAPIGSQNIDPIKLEKDALFSCLVLLKGVCALAISLADLYTALHESDPKKTQKAVLDFTKASFAVLSAGTISLQLALAIAKPTVSAASQELINNLMPVLAIVGALAALGLSCWAICEGAYKWNSATNHLQHAAAFFRVAEGSSLLLSNSLILLLATGAISSAPPQLMLALNILALACKLTAEFCKAYDKVTLPKKDSSQTEAHPSTV